MVEEIKANAEMVVRELRPLSGIDFGYTKESVEWVEGYIERLRVSGEFDNDEMKEKLISVFGSFLGECIIHCYGGTWQEHELGWCVAFPKGGMAFPFHKVKKQMENGLFDSIRSFFTVMPVIFDDLSYVAPSTPRKPWWKVW